MTTNHYDDASYERAEYDPITQDELVELYAHDRNCSCPQCEGDAEEWESIKTQDVVRDTRCLVCNSEVHYINGSYVCMCDVLDHS